MRPRVPVAAKIQIKGSSFARRDGSDLLASRQFLKNKALGMNANGEMRPVRGDARAVRRIVDGGPR